MKFSPGIFKNPALIIVALNVFILVFSSSWLNSLHLQGYHFIRSQLIFYYVLGFITVISSLLAAMLSARNISSQNLFRKISSWLLISIGVFILSWLTYYIIVVVNAFSEIE